MISESIGGCSSSAQARLEEGDELIGRLVDGRYRIRARLGAGAMGVVYDGVHEALERRVAIKILRREHRSAPVPLETFHREARTLAAVENPHIVEVHDLGDLDEGRAFVVTEHLEGRELSARLADVGALPWREAVEIALQVCDGMRAAHEAGVIHRDLKPENLFLTRAHPRWGGTCVKILDFGIAKLLDAPAREITFAGQLVGTPEYMSPEQCRGLPVDHRADIYALGAIVYEMVSGEVPFSGESVFAILERQLRDVAPRLVLAAHPLAVPAELDRIVARCLAKDPDERFESMDALAEALYDLVAHEDDTTLPSAPPPECTSGRGPSQRAASPPPLVAIVGAVAGLSFVGLWLLGALAVVLAALASPERLLFFTSTFGLLGGS